MNNKSDNFKKALLELENDCAAELNSHKKHHAFKAGFEKKALLVCRGQDTASGAKRTRRIPIWAAAMIVVLMCALIIGCAVAVYKYYIEAKFVPGYGITDINENMSIFATEKEFFVDDIQVETVLFVGDKEKGTLYLWVNGPHTGTWESIEQNRENPILEATIDGKSYPVFCSSASFGTDSAEYMCELCDVPFDRSMTLSKNGKNIKVKFADQTNKGYNVEEWGSFDGITVKALPLYANNRVVFLHTEGLADASNVSATVTVYDSLGNKASSGSGWHENGGFVLDMGKQLEGKISKIDIDSLRVTYDCNEKFTLPIPKDGENLQCDITLASNEVFTERVLSVSRKGNTVVVETEISAHKYQPLTDVFIDYTASDASHQEYSIEGIDKFTYYFELDNTEAELELSLTKYTYIIFNGDMPLCSIKIK